MKGSMMKQNKRKASGAFLILGMVFFIIGLSTDNTAFTWAAIAFIVISLVLGGRWMRPRK
jgi:uncharacterized membrane protein HdeD (DUF308 family)